MSGRDRAERAACPHCATEQALRRDGTLYKHTVYVDFKHQTCPGSGQKPSQGV